MDIPDPQVQLCFPVGVASTQKGPLDTRTNARSVVKSPRRHNHAENCKVSRPRVIICAHAPSTRAVEIKRAPSGKC